MPRQRCSQRGSLRNQQAASNGFDDLLNPRDLPVPKVIVVGRMRHEGGLAGETLGHPAGAADAIPGHDTRSVHTQSLCPVVWLFCTRPPFDPLVSLVRARIWEWVRHAKETSVDPAR